MTTTTSDETTAPASSFLNADGKRGALRCKYEVRVGNRWFTVVLKRYGQDQQWNPSETWVDLEELLDVAGHSVPRMIFNFRVEDEVKDLECFREAFRKQRSRLKAAVRDWNFWRVEAASSRGYQKGQCTKSVNFWAKRIPDEAEKWKLCKLVWKELTKL